MPYTDVDRLILERWTEVNALREAFDELLERMREPIETAARRVKSRCDELGLASEYDVKQPSFDFWKNGWANRRDKAGIYFRIGDFAPFEYGNVKSEHPWLWVLTHDLDALRIKGTEAVQFAKELRAHLGSEAAKWDDPDVVDASEPLGRYCSEVPEADRVRWMTHPDELAGFLVKGVEELMTLAPAIDVVLEKYRKR